MSDERLEAVRARITPKLEEAIRTSAADGTLPRPLREAIGDVAALGAGNTPLEAGIEVAALEAIVQRTGRPPLLIRNDEVEMEPLVDFPANTDTKLVGLNPRIPSVGRVEFLNHRMSWGGTGWVVEKKNGAYLIVTNRHVAKLVAQRTANGTGAFMRSPVGPRYGAKVDFHEEALSPDNDESRTVSISDITYIADDLGADMAVLRVTASPFEITPLTLSATEAKTGDLIALIGYPAFDSRNNASDQARYFRDLYDVKRMAPGKVMQALSGKTTLTHDATTLGGNSGSPVFSLETGHVVGLHFSGEYGIANTAVGVTTIKKVLSGSTTMVAVSGKTEGRADGHHDADVFAGRKGFSTAFLKDGEIKTPWPALPDATKAALAEPSDSPSEHGEIRYTHFGVKYSAADKLPIMTAVNIDGSKAVRIKRGSDQWFTDGRVDSDVQLAADNFKDLEIDRGHMVRREDPNWGDDGTARQANDDTFHYVNAAAQHSRMNQGKTLWQGLENYILDNSRTHGFCACVFTGPVLGPDDNIIDGSRVPEEFWKVVATLDESGSKLRATAYLLSQGQLIRDLMEKRSRTEAMEGVVLGEYRTFQIAVEDLAEATGYDFSVYAAADPLKREPGVEAADDGPRFVPIDDFENLIL
ncbi:MAG: nuclease [Sphingomonas sp.]|nr:nuclease [Sphingomonas sp.]